MSSAVSLKLRFYIFFSIKTDFMYLNGKNKLLIKQNFTPNYKKYIL